MKKSLFTLLFFTTFGLAFAQTNAKKGNYSFLKGQDKLEIVFDYANMKVGNGMTEDQYVDKKVEEHNKKEAGKGDIWKEGWYNSREERYEPKFADLLNKELGNSGLTASKGISAKYKVIVRTTYTEPGFNVGVMKKPAAANFEFVFIEVASNKEVGKYILQNIPGSQAMGYDYDAGSRIAECYAKAGKMLGSYIAKALK